MVNVPVVSPFLLSDLPPFKKLEHSFVILQKLTMICKARDKRHGIILSLPWEKLCVYFQACLSTQSWDWPWQPAWHLPLPPWNG